MSRSRDYFLAPAVVAVLALGSVANADIIYDNMPGSTAATHAGFQSINSSGGAPLADSFSTGSSATVLSGLELLLAATTPSDGAGFTVALYSNNSSGSNPVPGTLLETIATVQDSSLTTSFATYTYTPTPFALLANTRYWIELSGSSDSGQWSYDNTNVGVGVASEYNYFFGSSFANSGFTPFQMQVTVFTPSAVPEPASLAMFAVGLAAVAVARRRLAAR